MICWKSHYLVAIISVFLGVTDARITSLFATSKNDERITETNEGCQVHFICEGIGTTAVWRVFGNRDPIVTNNNIRVITQEQTGDGTSPIRSEIVFSPIFVRNSGAYTCTIGSNTRTVRISVSNAVNIVPGNLEYDISDFYVGDTFPVICDIETCLSDLTVAVRRDSNVLHELSVSDLRNDPQFNLDVALNIQGQHDCHVMYSFGGMDQMVYSAFNITGSPNIPATTAKPTRGSSSTSIISPLFTLLIFSVTLFMALLT